MLDVDRCKIEMLNAGQIPVHEPGLESIVRRNAAAGRPQFTTDAAASVAHSTMQFIGVGTPPGEDGLANLQYVLAAARSIGRHMTDYKVVDMSTVPVGTADEVRSTIAWHSPSVGCPIWSSRSSRTRSSSRRWLRSTTA